jgi:sRNA-binding regulator protein Hfq
MLTVVATAQRIPQNTIYLKNGSVIKGTIIEDIEGVSIKVQTADKSIWVFKKADVNKVITSVKAQTTPMVDYTLKRGYFTQVQAELMPSKKQSSEGTVPSMLGVAGYQINKHFSAGVGTGVEAFHISMLPVFGDMRYYFFNDQYTPFINLKAGYAFPLENQRDNTRNVDMKSKGGLMGGLELGYIRSLSNATKFTFSLGYRYQRLVQTGSLTEYMYTPVVTGTNTFTGTNTYQVDRKIASDFDRLVITIGLRFR